MRLNTLRASAAILLVCSLAAPTTSIFAVHAAQSVAMPPASGAPEPTENEKLRLENLQLKFSALQAQQMDLQNQYVALIRQIEAEHPGFTFNLQTGKLTPVVAPQTKPATEPAKKETK